MGEFEKALEKYAKYVIQQARSNLTKGKKNYSKKLYNSLSYKVSKKGVLFPMEQYGLFQDEGVKGKDPSKVSPNAKIKGQQAPNSQYKFGSGTSKGTFKQFTALMAEYAQKKNIRFRDAEGKYSKGGFKSVGYIIASNIYNRGLRPTMFFTKPFEAGLDKFSDDIVLGFIDDNLKLE